MDRQVFAGPGSVPHMVARAVARIGRAYRAAQDAPAARPCQRARKYGRVAELFEREARWWSVLGRWTCGQHEVPWVFVSAGVAAEQLARQRAEQYRELESREWTRALAVAADSGLAA